MWLGLPLLFHQDQVFDGQIGHVHGVNQAGIEAVVRRVLQCGRNTDGGSAARDRIDNDFEVSGGIDS